MQNQQRYIAHFDLDSFFVSVEVLKDPALKGKAVVVGGHSERGVVTAASYEARKFGVHSAMAMKRALQLCPHAIVKKGSYHDYAKYSRLVTDIIAAKAPLFQKASIDEFYIDLTGMDKYFDVFKWTIALREEIIEKTGLPISFALASNKLVAKIATDEAKPNGYLQVAPGFEKAFLAPLKVNKIPGVGEHTYQLLLQLGIQTIHDLTLFTSESLEHHLGKMGVDLYNKAQGLHYGLVSQQHDAKSISTENTFEENSASNEFLMAELVRMTEKVAFELRQDGKLAGCVAVKIRYGNFNTFSKQQAINSTCLDDELIATAKLLFLKLYKTGTPVRLLGVRLSDLNNLPVQANLFNNDKKKADLYKAIDEVKNKFGRAAVKKARTL